MTDKGKNLWELAEASLNEHDRENLNFPGAGNIDIISSLREATTEAQKVCISKRWQFTTPGTSGEKVVIRDLLSKIATWAELFGQIGDQLVQFGPAYVSLPWAGIRFLLQIATADLKKFDFVVKGAEQIARMVTRYKIFEKLYLEQSSMAAKDLKLALIKLYASMMIYLASAKRYFELQTGVRILKSGTLARGDFEELSDQMNAAESEVDRYAALVAAERQKCMNDQMATLSLEMKERDTALQKMLKDMDRPIYRMSSRLDSVEDHLQKLERLKVLDWISTQPYLDHHSHQIFKSWRSDSSNSLLWLHGMQGTGKSSLISIVVEELMNDFANGLGPLPVFFYCSRSTAEPERSNAVEILGCLVRQLSCLSAGSSVLSPTLDLYERITSQGSSRKLNLEELCKLIVELTEHYPITTIIVDALDECKLETRGDLIESLETILQDSTSLVKVLISSREENDIKFGLQDHPGIQVTAGENEGDINAFVDAETDRLVAKNRLLGQIRSKATKDDLKTLIKADVIRGAGGMFRWAQLQLQSLQGIRFEKDIRAALGKIPRELSDLYHELYERMVSSEHETDRLIVTNVLRWMLCARRRLTADDFFVAISLNLDVPAEDIHEDLILDLLHNFVVSDNDEGIQTFRFAHLSVREFLEKRPEYSWKANNSLCAEICLLAIIGTSKSPVAVQFLHDRGLNSSDMGLSTTESYKNGIYDYSLRFWAMHSQQAGEQNRTTKGPLKETFNYFLFNDSDEDNPLNCWLRSRQRKKLESRASRAVVEKLKNHRRSIVRAFFLGCAFGFLEVVAASIKDPEIDHDLKEEGLLIAIVNLKSDVVKLVLTSMPEFKVPETLLIELVEAHVEFEVLKWLLEWQKSIKITKRIVLAAKRTNAEIMTLLLDHSQGLKITDDMLESAAWAAEASTIRVLLSRACSPKITTATLSAAVRWGDSEVVQLLLNVGISPETITPEVLGQAAYAGNVETLNLLLEKSNNSNITEEIMMDAVPCRDGCETVQILIDRGGKVTQPVAIEGASQGSAAVLKLLLQQGGQITCQMLEVGARNVIDGTEVIRLLLQRDKRVLAEEEWIEVLKKAAQNTWFGPGVTALLLDAKPTCQIAEEVLLAVAVKNVISGTEILNTLLKDGRDMEITSDVIEAVFLHLDYGDAFRRLLDKYSSNIITVGMLTAAARSSKYGDEIMSFLLNRSYAVEIPNDEVVKAVVSNAHSGFEMLRLLENKFGKFTFNEASIEAAVARGSPEVVKLILGRQPATQISESLLLITASSGNTEVMKLLLERSNIAVTEEMVIAAACNEECGADMTRLLLNHSHEIIVTPAMINKVASRDFNEDALPVLLSRGGRMKLVANTLAAIVRKYSFCGDVVSILLQADIDLEVTEEVFVELAKTADAMETARLFAEHGFKVKPSANIVESALKEDDPTFLAFLLKEVDQEFKIHHKMLDFAARNGQTDVLKLLLEHGPVGLDKSDWLNIARFRNAAFNGKADEIRELLRLGVEPDLPDSTGRTPLSWSVAPGDSLPDYWLIGPEQEEVVKLLVDAKVDIEMKSHNGRTPLCWAAFGNQRAAVKVLLDAGALTQVQDEKGDTPASLARKQGHLRLAKKLEK